MDVRVPFWAKENITGHIEKLLKDCEIEHQWLKDMQAAWMTILRLGLDETTLMKLEQAFMKYLNHDYLRSKGQNNATSHPETT